MLRRFACRIGVCAVVVAWSAAAWGAIPVQVQANFYGADFNEASWNVVPTAVVSLQPGSSGQVSIKGQIVCPGGDLNGSGKCTSGSYMYYYQVQNAPPGTTLRFTNVPGFNFSAGNAFGAMKCDPLNAGNTKALCSGDGTVGAPNNLNDAQIAALNLSAFGGGPNITFVMPNQVGSKLAFFLIVSGQASVPPLPSVLVQVDPTPPQSNKYYLPHVPSGLPGYVTKITVVNTSTSQADGVINFVDQAGNFVRSQGFSIASGGSFRVQTDEATRYSPSLTNWAIVGSSQPVGVNLFFEFIAQGTGVHAVINTVGFNAPPLSSGFTIPVESEPKPGDAAIGRTVGVALANPTSQAIIVTVKLLDQNGNVLNNAGVNIPLPAFGQTAFDIQSTTGIKEFLPSAQNFKGSLTFSSSTPIAAIGLFDDFGPFSGTPILDGKAK